jgi:periplasmic protein TonB
LTPPRPIRLSADDNRVMWRATEETVSKFFDRCRVPRGGGKGGCVADTMFRDVVEPSIHVGGKQALSVPISMSVHAALIATAIIVPLVAPGALPVPQKILAFIAPASPPAPPPLPAAPISSGVPGRILTTNPAVAPVDAPTKIVAETPVPSSGGEPPGAVGNFSGTFQVGRIENPVAPPPPAVVQTAPVRLGGNIKQPAKTRDVRPAYPPIALASKVEGIVIIEATIGPTGKVQDARVLRSHPLLEEAALAAVREWEFTPTLLNGSAVPVIMTVTVDFRLR